MSYHSVMMEVWNIINWVGLTVNAVYSVAFRDNVQQGFHWCTVISTPTRPERYVFGVLECKKLYIDCSEMALGNNVQFLHTVPVCLIPRVKSREWQGLVQKTSTNANYTCNSPEYMGICQTPLNSWKSSSHCSECTDWLTETKTISLR